MTVLRFSSSIMRLLEEIDDGSAGNKALELMVSGVKNHLKECELEILEYETKYGYSFDTFKEKLNSGELGNEFSFNVEKDAMRWEDLLVEKKKWIEIIKKTKSLPE